jgi:hypothetical protein
MQDWREYVDKILKAQAVISLCFLICVAVLAKNEYAGVVGIFIALFYIIFTYVTYRGILLETNRVYYGAILGGCSLLLLVSLESSIFYGEYSKCSSDSHDSSNIITTADDDDDDDESGIHYSDDTRRLITRSLREVIGVQCSKTSAMKAACVFSSAMLLSYLLLIIVLYSSKNEILVFSPNTNTYNPLSTDDKSENHTEQNSQQRPSTDL